MFSSRKKKTSQRNQKNKKTPNKTTPLLQKDTGLATKAMDYVHEPVRMHNVLDPLKELPVPHVLVVRLVLETINHCGGKSEHIKQAGHFTDMDSVRIIFWKIAYLKENMHNKH